MSTVVSCNCAKYYGGDLGCGDCGPSLGFVECNDCGYWKLPEDMSDFQDDLCYDCQCDKYEICNRCNEYFAWDYYGDGVCEPCQANPFPRLEGKAPPEPHTWATWAKVADHAGSIDFGCDFGCNGCRGQREEASQWYKSEQGCCSGCADNVGYLDAIPSDAVDEVRAVWDDIRGFWSPAGCRLPAKYRSSICLGYRCYQAEKGAADKEGFTALTQLIRKGA